LKKNIVLILLFSIIMTFFNFSFAADQKTILYSHSSKTDTVAATQSHFTTSNVWGTSYCSSCNTTHYNGSPHCVTCGSAHSQADFAYTPSCACSKTTGESAPDGYKFVRSYFEEKKYGCDNASRIGAGAQEQTVICTLIYHVYEKEEESSCNHTDDVCSRHNQRYGGYHVDYSPTYTSKIYCEECEKTYYKGVSCSKEETPPEEEEEETPIEEDVIDEPEPLPCILNYSYEHRPYHSDEVRGSQGTDPDDTPFSGTISVESTKPNYVKKGDKIAINGNLHIVRNIHQEVTVIKEDYVVSVYETAVCSVHTPCGSSYTDKKVREYDSSYTITTWKTPTYSDMRYDGILELKGVRLNNNSSNHIVIPPKGGDGKDFGTTLRVEHEPFAESYDITDIITEELEYDEAKGWAYATVKLYCSRGCCTKAEKRIYIDWIPNKGEVGKISIETDGNGMISLNAAPFSTNTQSAIRLYDATHTIWAKPNSGYRFVKWVKSESGEYHSDIALKNEYVKRGTTVKLKAIFEEDNPDWGDYKVIVRSNGGGKIALDDSGEVSRFEKEVDAGTNVSISSYPDEDYEFVKWEIIQSDARDFNTIYTTFSENTLPNFEQKVEYNYEFIAHFEPISIPTPKKGELVVKSNNPDMGYVIGNEDNAVIGHDYLIRAVPYEGYRFLYWKEEARIDELEYNAEDYVTMPDVNKYVLVAYFEEDGGNEPKLTVKSNGDGNVKIDANTPSKSQFVDEWENGYHNIKAIPDTGYEFVKWVDEETGDVYSEQNENKITTPTRDLTLVAYFEKLPNYTKLTVKAESSGTVSINSTTDSYSEQSITAEINSTQVIRAFPACGYRFVKWIVESNGEEYSSDAEKNVIMPEEDLTLVAVFERIDGEYRVGVYSDGNGLVSIDNSPEELELVKYVDRNTVVDVVAYPREDFEFDYWEIIQYSTSGELSCSKNEECKFNKEILTHTIFIAHFKPIDLDDIYGRLIVKSSDETKGFAFATVEYAIKGEAYPIHAISFDGYEFKYWNEEGKEEALQYLADDFVEMPDVKEYVIVANFDDIAQNKSKLTVKVQGKGNVSIDTSTPSPEQAIMAGWGSNHDINAYPEDGYQFVKWIIEETGTEYSKDEFNKVTMPQKDLTLIAVFEKINTTKYKVIVYSDGNGKVSLDGSNETDEVTKTVKHGQEVEVKAYGSDMFEFGYWEVVTYTGPADVKYDEDSREEFKQTIQTNYIFIAHFVPTGSLPEYGRLEVESSDENKGLAFVDVEYALFGKEYKIHAIKFDGYKFVGWTEEEDETIFSRRADDSIKMPKVEEYVLIAHFDDIISGGGGGGSDPDPDKEVTIRIEVEGDGKIKTEDKESDEYIEITGKEGEQFPVSSLPEEGNKFKGLYDEKGNIITYNENTILTFGSEDEVIIAKFIPKTGTEDEAGEAGAFTINSIRDLRWQNYFTSDGQYNYNNAIVLKKEAQVDTILVNDAELNDSNFDKYKDIVYGYAVELGLETISLDLVKDTPELTVNVKLYGDGTQLDPNKFDINGNSDDAKKFFKFSNNTPGNVFMFETESFTRVNNGYDYPGINWRWIYYLPTNMNYNNDGPLYMQYDQITVEFDVVVSAKNITDLHFIKALNALDYSNWGGKVFRYRTKIDDRPYTVLNDLTENLTH